MKTIELDMYQATAVAALVLLLGRILVAKISILRRYCIPAPVVGGFLYAIVHTIVRGMGILEISCDFFERKESEKRINRSHCGNVCRIAAKAEFLFSPIIENRSIFYLGKFFF